MMNLIQLGKTIVQNYFFMRTLTQQLGEPVYLTETACQKAFNALKENPTMAQKFALICNVKTLSIDSQHNTKNFLKYTGNLDLNKFFMLLHPDFMVDYIRWGQATYSYLLQHPEIEIVPLHQCTRINIPLQLSDGRYHWVMQEALPLQLDAQGKLITHLNIYTILHEMAPDENVPLVSRLYNNGFEVKEWSQTVWKTFFTHRPFLLTPAQRQIIETLLQHPQFRNAEIAAHLQKNKNTIDIQNKQILACARIAFPNQPFDNLKEVVHFLREIRYFEAW
jgi:hypothetical protein